MTIIKDPIMEPFYIGKDNYCYTVYEVVTPDTENVKTKGKGKVYEKPVGHYSDFGRALECVAKSKTNSNTTYGSIQEYLSNWNSIKNEINQLTDLGL